MEDDTIFAVLTAGMVIPFVLANQPWMIIHKIKGVSHIVVNVTDDVSQENKQLEKAELDVVPSAMKTLHHFAECGKMAMTDEFL